jgi:Cu+-exporting ATPase
MQIAHAPWMNWLMLALATPVQFYSGLAVLRGRIQSPAQWFGQHGRADRHGLIRGPTSILWPIILACSPGHVYLETAAVIITLIRLCKFLEARAKAAPVKQSRS